MKTETAKHTPGPWKVLDGAILSEHTNEYGNFIVASLGREMTVQDDANFNLIASAPDLLEACKDVLKWLEINHRASEFNFFVDLKKAINRAEGSGE